MISYEAYLRESAIPREEIDLFLDPRQPSWAQFDPELGYVLGNDMPRNGIDGSRTISTVAPSGARTSIVYADRPCRINTYGDSFTECHQVSDHETWQEYLAAHLGEPIRNYGVGGYGVYQAYRRMVRTELGPDGARYVMLYIWGDDHHRSLMRCRHVAFHRWWDRKGGRLLHGNFWANLEMDLDSGHFVEKGNLLPTPESLYRMADPGYLVEALRDDLMLQMTAFTDGVTSDVDLPQLGRLASALGVPPLRADDADGMRREVSRLRDAYAFAATRHIVERALEFTRGHGKELMLLLLCPTVTRQLISTGQRYDQPIVDFLQERGVRYFDMNLAHVADYGRFRLSVDDYMKRYYIGHYSPAGNHLFAFALKDAVVEWLDPKPVTYRPGGEAAVSFEGYLPRTT